MTKQLYTGELWNNLPEGNLSVHYGSNLTDNISDVHGDSQFLIEQNNKFFMYHLPAIVYTAIMMFVGLPGNMVVFYIYFFKWRRSTSRMFILFLAALDMVNCATTLPMEIYIMRYSIMLDKPVLCKLSRFSTYTMNSSSALILLGIAVDRFKRICRPYQKSFSETVSKHICIGAIFFSLCSTWPSIMFYGTRIINNLGKVQGKACLLENKYDQSSYPLIYLGFMGTTTMIVFAALVILYYFVGLQIYKHRKFKLKNCTHVQKFVEDKSVTVKSEGVKSSNDKTPSSKDIVTEKNERDDKVNIVIQECSDNQTNQLQTYQIAQPEPSQDPGTTCGMLDVPCVGHEVTSDKSSMEFSSRNITVESSMLSYAHSNDGQNEENNIPEVIQVPTQKISPNKRKPKVRRKTRKVRYLLVRGSSTLNASGRVKCTDCLTVRIGRSTLMLFLITIVYILSFLPFYIIVIVRQMDKTFVKNLSPQGYMAYQVFLRSYLLSSAINPIIYSFCNAQFRAYVCDLLDHALNRRRESMRDTKSRFRR